MKKFIFVMLTAGMAMCFAACANDASTKQAAVEQDNMKQVEAPKEAPEAPKTVTVDDMKAVVEKAKAEGAGWSIDQWKDATRQIMLGMKPFFDTLLELQSKTEDRDFEKQLKENPAEATKLLDDLQKKLKEFAPMETIMKDFEAAANATENGKKVTEDETFGKQLKKELGLPEEGF